MQNTPSDWKLVIQYGLLGGTISLLLSLVGMVIAFGDNFIISGVISMGQIMLIAPILLLSYTAVNKASEQTTWMRIIFGLGGLAGVWLSSRNMWSKITPPVILVSWFMVIAFFGALGIYKNLSGDTTLYYAFSLRSLSELNEMLIGLSSLLFIWMNMRRFGLARNFSLSTVN